MRGKSNIYHLIVHLLLLAGIVIVVFPFVWMVLTSFKTNGEALHIPPTILPEQFVTAAYTEILGALPFATVYMNTIISTVITTVGQVLFCSMAAYAFARIEFPFKNAIFCFGSFCIDGTGTDLPDPSVYHCAEAGTP